MLRDEHSLWEEFTGGLTGGTRVALAPQVRAASIALYESRPLKSSTMKVKSSLGLEATPCSSPTSTPLPTPTVKTVTPSSCAACAVIRVALGSLDCPSVMRMRTWSAFWRPSWNKFMRAVCRASAVYVSPGSYLTLLLFTAYFYKTRRNALPDRWVEA